MPNSLITDVGSYDDGLGVNPTMIDYVLESHWLQIQISHHHCYILRRNSDLPPISNQTVSTWEHTLADGDRCAARIWDTGSLGNQPDLRPGADFSVNIGASAASRVLDYRDLLSDGEYSVHQDESSPGRPIYLVFNEGFDATGETVTYSHATIGRHYSAGTDQPSAHESPDLGTKYYWIQWTGSLSNIVKVRLPIAPDQLVPDELGRMTLKESQCWMLAADNGYEEVPFVRNHDILVVPATGSLDDRLFLIYDKEDSEIQGRFTHQRFRVQYIEATDPRYDITLLP